MTTDPSGGQCPAHRSVNDTAGHAATATQEPPPDHPLPIFGTEFSANPRATYERLRAQGPIAPVEISPGVYGYLTTTYRSALYLLRNTPNRFAKNPRHWQALREGHVPADSPAAMMMGPRDNALWMDGPAHARHRRAITGSLEKVDTHALADTVTAIADQLIDTFCADGRADLVPRYADPLPMMTLIKLFGCPDELGHRIVQAIGQLFDGTDAAQASANVHASNLELVYLKRREPADDVTSWLLQHEAGLDDEEMIQTILLVIGAATTPSSNLIMNGLLRMITDSRFAGNVHDGVQPVSDAVDEVLWNDPPMANYSPLYALGYQTYEGITIHPGYPVLVSFAAANSDPALGMAPGSRAGNRGHLAFSAGVHACPAPDLARIITETAIERILDRLQPLTFAGDISRRPGTYHSGLTELLVHFQPTSPLASSER
ncbi:cytochrome P450 [Streptomyces lonarensis]|uniref:Cytochrome P450 n=1 Tax=Streptomyces lonarensis TaxID=700599 RepID=A0A7X6D3C5_9ACTN|nr:cytochrome P450 [Streptomyces lonarensis]NJQ07417.1 cytochrome P450 [Streptomyces lonarensis]